MHHLLPSARVRAFLLAALLATTAFLAMSQPADAYLHVENAQAGVRYGGGGDRQRDDDIHAFGAAIGASGWGGWATIPAGGYTRLDAYAVNVHAIFYDHGARRVYTFWVRGNDGSFHDGPI